MLCVSDDADVRTPLNYKTKPIQKQKKKKNGNQQQRAAAEATARIETK